MPRVSSSRINDERFASGWVRPYHFFANLVLISIRVGGRGPDLPDHQTPHRSAGILPNRIGSDYNRRPLGDQDQTRSPREYANILHSKNYIRHKNPNFQSNPAAGVPVLEEDSQVLQHDMTVGMVGIFRVSRRKLCGLRAFVAFSGFGPILLGVEPEVAW